MAKQVKFILVLPDGEKFTLKRDPLVPIGDSYADVISQLAEMFSTSTYVTIPVEPSVGVISKELIVLWGDKLKNSHLEVREMD